MIAAKSSAGSYLDFFRNKIDSQFAAFANACVRCGLCAESCHYFLATGDPKTQPAYKVKVINSIFRRHFMRLGNPAANVSGRTSSDQRVIDEWVDSLLGNCSMCGRCNLHCTVGINISRMVRTCRSVLHHLGLTPNDLQSTVDLATTHGNNMGIAKTEWIETAAWLEEELQQELGVAQAKLPIDQKRARLLYTINPREAKFFPLSIVAAAKIFYAAGEKWTLPSDYYDVTNYGLFNGDDEAAGLIARRLYQTAGQLEAEVLVLGECGHGFAANRWEGPEWVKASPRIPVMSILEIIADYIRDGRIKLDPARNAKRVTLHDPCNLVRMGGVIEEQRYILKNAVADFVEMYPNRENNFCCGGGGGQLAMARYAERRIAAGKIKAEQIRATGAEIVVAPCHNCLDQLSELNKEYKLGVQIRTVAEIVADAVAL